MIETLALTFVFTMISSPVFAYNPNTYIPTPDTANLTPELSEFAIELKSKNHETREDAVKSLEAMIAGKTNVAHAHFLLGFYWNSNFERNLKTSRSHFEQCVIAVPLNSDCQIWLGLYQLYGAGGDKSETLAAKAFEASSNTGSKIGQWHLGMAYLKGEGVKKDEGKAFALVTQSAKQDYVPALMSYGTMHALGQGTSKNLSEAFKATARAALTKDNKALARVATSYEKGLGVPINLDLADAAYVLASKQGHRPSIQLIRKMTSSIPEEQAKIWLQKAFDDEKQLLRELKAASDKSLLQGE